MCVIPLSSVVYGAQLSYFRARHLYSSDVYESYGRFSYVVHFAFSGFDALPAGLVRVWEHDAVPSHPLGYFFCGQFDVGAEYVAEGRFDFVFEQYDSVVFSASDFEFVFGGSS